MNSINICRSALFCIMAASGAVSIAAQQPGTPDCTAIYDRLLTNKKGPELAKYRTALSAGNEFIDKCSKDPEQEKITAYVAKQIPPLADTIKGIELGLRFDAATQADNKDEIIASGKELLARNHAASLDIMIILASVGYNKAIAASPVDTMNEDTIRYAKSVIEKINAGAKSENYGAFKYRYKTKDCSDGAANTVGWMNRTIADILAVRQKKMTDALPYYYKAVQTGCETKDSPEIYSKIGLWYLEDGKKIEASLKEKLTASKNEETAEIKALDALSNGYLDRTIDAYARAYKSAAAKADLPQAAKDSYRDRLKAAYEGRFDGKMEGFDQYLAKVSTTPFPDPTTEVKPALPDPVVAPPPPAATPPAKPANKTPAKPPKAAAKRPRKK
jgi:hypothetical protein